MIGEIVACDKCHTPTTILLMLAYLIEDDEGYAKCTCSRCNNTIVINMQIVEMMKQFEIAYYNEVVMVN